MHHSLRAVKTVPQLCLRCIHQMDSCQVACPAAVMNLCHQERPSDLLLQTGTQLQASLMTQIKGQAPWSLLRLDLEVLAGCHQGTTLCNASGPHDTQLCSLLICLSYSGLCPCLRVFAGWQRFVVVYVSSLCICTHVLSKSEDYYSIIFVLTA